MNKQCQAKDCKEWPDDGDWVKVGNRTLCKDCVVNDSKAAKVYVLVTTSYSDEAGKEAATIVQELEDSKVGLQMEVERLTEENESLRKVNKAQRGICLSHQSVITKLSIAEERLLLEVERLRGDLEAADNACGIWQAAFMDLKEQPRKPLGNL